MSLIVRAVQHSICRGLNEAHYQLYTLWLFIFSDLKTIVIPSTIFGIVNAWAAARYCLSVSPAFAEHDALSHLSRFFLGRLPSVLFWVLLNFVPFAISNQRNASAVAEDRINKPWRPFPSGRTTTEHATAVMRVLYIAAQCYSLAYSGGLRQTLALLILGTWYNNGGGADWNPLVRNLINAMGYMCFTTGAMEVALGGMMLSFSFQQRLTRWLLVIAGIIVSTVHLQDLPDQAGDAERSRHTVPLVMGDSAARWSIALPMIGWGILCPIFWDIHPLLWSGQAALAWTVALRTLIVRHVSGDQLTFRIWNVWVACVYLMPLAAGDDPGRPAQSDCMS